MGYYLDDKVISLNDLSRRIEAIDLVPSRSSLKENLEETISALEEFGIHSVYELRQNLINAKKMEILSQGTGIPMERLVLLRREVEGYFPRPFPLKEVEWVPGEIIRILNERGISDTASLYEALEDGLLEGIGNGLPAAFIHGLDELKKMAGLTRVQWVNPTAARMILEAGVNSARELARADPDELYARLAEVNKGGRYFKGTIGLRDVRRIIAAAAYLPG